MKKNIGYWATTLVVSAMLLMSGAMDLMHAPQLMEAMRHLGYPDYVATILGVWKLLGVAVILLPGFPRVKEWAYAGIVFDLSGAAISHGTSGDPAAKVAVPLVLLVLALASWALRPASRMLEEQKPERQPNILGTLRSIIRA